MSRCLKNERYGRPVFYGAMIMEGVVADEERQARSDFCEQTLCNLLFRRSEFKFAEPLQERTHGHLHEFGDGLASNLNVGCFGTETRAPAARTYRLAAVARQHDTVLYLVLCLAQALEESIDGGQPPFFFFGGQLPLHVGGRFAVPKPVFLCLCKLVIGFVNGETAFGIEAYEPCSPLTEFLAPPAHHSTVVNGAAGVGYHKTLVNTDDASVAFAFRTGAQRRVEGEELVGWLHERDSVSLETRGEGVGDSCWHYLDEHLSTAFVEGSLDRVGEAGQRLFVFCHCETVHHKQYVVAVQFEALESLCFECLHAGFRTTHHHEFRTLAVFGETAHDVLHTLLLYLFAGDGAESASDACVE